MVPESNSLKKTYGSMQLKQPEQRFCLARPRTNMTALGFRKKPRLVIWQPALWTPDAGHRRLEICGDSKVIINWVNGVWPAKFMPYTREIGKVQRRLHELVNVFDVRPKRDVCDFCRHIYRELNTEADRLAYKHASEWSLEAYSEPAPRIRGFFDGSVQGDKAAFGWIVFALDVDKVDSRENWVHVASKSGTLPDTASITAAELEGLSSITSFLRAYYISYEDAMADMECTTNINHKLVRVLTLADLL